MPRRHAASMIENASASVSPCPKNSGAEPMPPKLPHPRTMRESSTPDPPTRRRSTDRFYGGSGTIPRMFACPAAPPPDPPWPQRPRYELLMRIQPGYRRVDGRLRVRFTPNLATHRIVFRLWPNGPTQRAEGMRLT